MANLATAMNWILQVVDRGATATMSRYSRQVGGTSRATHKFGMAARGASANIRGYAVEAAVAGAATFAIGIAMHRSIKRFAEFEERLKATELVLRPTRKEMDKLTHAARMMPGAVEFGPSQLAQAQRQLSQAGLTTTETLASLGGVADVATAGMLDLKTATELNINLLRGFRIPISESAAAMDKLTRATQLSPLTLDSASKALGFATASASAFDQSLDSTLISLALLIPITRTASKAGTAFRSSMRAIFRTKGFETLNQLGVSPVDAAGQARDVIDIIQEVATAIETKIPAAQRKVTLSQLFGIRGMQLYSAVQNAQVRGSGDFEGMTLRGAEAIEEMRKQVKKSQGITAKFAKEMRGTYSKSLQRFGASTESLSIALGEGLEPVLKGLLNVTTPMVSVFTSFMTSMDGWPATILATGTALTFMSLGLRTVASGMMALRASFGGAGGIGAAVGMGGGVGGMGGGGMGGMGMLPWLVSGSGLRSVSDMRRAMGSGSNLNNLIGQRNAAESKKIFGGGRARLSPGTSMASQAGAVTLGTMATSFFGPAQMKNLAAVPQVGVPAGLRKMLFEKELDKVAGQFFSPTDQRKFIANAYEENYTKMQRGIMADPNAPVNYVGADGLPKRNLGRRLSPADIARTADVEARSEFDEAKKKVRKLDRVKQKAAAQARVHTDAIEARQQAHVKSYKKLGPRLGRAATHVRNFGKSVGNAIGPMGMLMISVGALMFAFDRIKSTAEKLYAIDTQRIKVADAVRTRMMILPLLLAEMRKGVEAGRKRGDNVLDLGPKGQEFFKDAKEAGFSASMFTQAALRMQRGETTRVSEDLLAVAPTYSELERLFPVIFKGAEKAMQKAIRTTQLREYMGQLPLSASLPADIIKDLGAGGALGRARPNLRGAKTSVSLAALGRQMSEAERKELMPALVDAAKRRATATIPTLTDTGDPMSVMNILRAGAASRMRGEKTDQEGGIGQRRRRAMAGEGLSFKDALFGLPLAVLRMGSAVEQAQVRKDFGEMARRVADKYAINHKLSVDITVNGAVVSEDQMPIATEIIRKRLTAESREAGVSPVDIIYTLQRR